MPNNGQVRWAGKIFWICRVCRSIRLLRNSRQSLHSIVSGRGAATEAIRMATYFRASWILTCLMTLVGAGCCCTQGMNTCSSCSSCSSCPTGGCGVGPLLGRASCRGGCGEVYVDEWVSEPPCIDDCGYCNSGCDSCRSGRPLGSFLRLLWGTPYDGGCGCKTGCDSGCSAGCDGGCSSCGGGEMAVSMGPMPTKSCNCGASHASTNVHTTASPTIMAPANSAPKMGSPAPAVSAPTPAPVAPSSAKRLSPAQQRTTVARASTR